MSNSCSKCGVSITYGLMCAQCRLNSDITSTLFNNYQDNYDTTLPQKTYSNFRNPNFDKDAKMSALKKYLMDPKRYNTNTTSNNSSGKNNNYVFNFKDYSTKESIDSKVAGFKNATKSDKYDYVLTVSKDDSSSNYIINIMAVPTTVSSSYTIPYATRSQIPIGKTYYSDGKYSKKKYYTNNDGGSDSNGKQYDNKGAKDSNGSKGKSSGSTK